jgi:hypothetical protein
MIIYGLGLFVGLVTLPDIGVMIYVVFFKDKNHVYPR